MTGLLAGWRIVTFPERRPRLERVAFSGGVNLSAKARNVATMTKARRIYVVNGNEIHVPRWYEAEFLAGIQKAERQRE